MKKKTIVGLVLVAAAFGSVWAAGIASAGESPSKAPEVQNTVLTDMPGDTTAFPPITLG
ncbi:hypothetical protein GCM10022267_90930 [Lentzea roselyniae]|uniref:Uncharacterized protein n=1 Tax=Lentzea roselyniae TaxID=531940 RepID=A0ABP7CK39_9PSEU